MGTTLSFPQIHKAAPNNGQEVVNAFKFIYGFLQKLSDEERYNRSWLSKYDTYHIPPFVNMCEIILDKNPDNTTTYQPSCVGGDISRVLCVGNRPLFMVRSSFYDPYGRFYRHYILMPYMDNGGRMTGTMEIFYNPDDEHVLIDYYNKTWIDFRNLNIYNMK